MTIENSITGSCKEVKDMIKGKIEKPSRDEFKEHATGGVIQRAKNQQTLVTQTIWTLQRKGKRRKMEHNLLNTYKECIELYKKENEVNLKYANKQMAYMIGEWLGFSEEQVNKDLQQK